MHFYLLTVHVHMAKFTPCSYNYKEQIGFISSNPPTAFIADHFFFILRNSDTDTGNVLAAYLASLLNCYYVT